MNRDDIIRMAREALLPACHLTHPKALERFAALVAAAEREACAKLVEEYWEIDGTQTAKEFAAAIRAIGEK